MRSVLMISAAWAAFSVAAFAADFTVPVDQDFSEGEFAWEGDEPGVAYEYVYGLAVIDGKVAACGAGKFLNPTLAGPTRTFMRKSHVEFNGKIVLKDLSFFTKIRKGDDLRAAKATCRLTTVPVNAAAGNFTFVIAGGRTRI